MKHICQRVGRVAVLANMMAELQLTYYAITMFFLCVDGDIDMLSERSSHRNRRANDSVKKKT